MQCNDLQTVYKALNQALDTLNAIGDVGIKADKTVTSIKQALSTFECCGNPFKCMGNCLDGFSNKTL